MLKEALQNHTIFCFKLFLEPPIFVVSAEKMRSACSMLTVVVFNKKKMLLWGTKLCNSQQIGLSGCSLLTAAVFSQRLFSEPPSVGKGVLHILFNSFALKKPEIFHSELDSSKLFQQRTCYLTIVMTTCQSYEYEIPCKSNFCSRKPFNFSILRVQAVPTKTCEITHV